MSVPTARAARRLRASLALAAALAALVAASASLVTPCPSGSGRAVRAVRRRRR